MDAKGFENATADAVLERIEAEQAEVPRPAARRDARQDRDAQTADAFAGAGVEVGRTCRFQLGFAARLQRQTAQAVGDQQNDLRAVFFAQLAHQFVHVSCPSILPASSLEL